MIRGKFIVIEGGEGSGKSTMIERLKKVLPPDVVFARNPGSTSVGSKIREIVLSDDDADMNQMTRLLLFCAGRAELVAKIIAPSLENGMHVICDRYELSEFVYQVYGDQHEQARSVLERIASLVGKELVPDLTILLDVLPGIGIPRALARSETANLIDRKPQGYHERIRAGYMEQIKRYPHKIVDANRPLEEVWTDVRDAVQSVL